MSKLERLGAFASNIRESAGEFRRANPIARPARDVDSDRKGRERARDSFTIDLDRIMPDPDQPRKEFEPEALDRLAESLKTRGQLQPIQVRWDASADRYVIIMGERRWRAAQMAGIPSLACVVREGGMSDGEKLSIQLIENCLREDLSPIDQARAFRELMSLEGWTQEQLAERLAVNAASIGRALSLLRLPQVVQCQVEQGGLSQSHAIELAKLDDPAEQIRLASEIAEQGLTRDDVARQVKGGAKRKASAKKTPTVAVLRLGGYRIEISRKAGIEPETLHAALREAAEKYRPEPRQAGEAA